MENRISSILEEIFEHKVTSTFSYCCYSVFFLMDVGAVWVIVW